MSQFLDNDGEDNNSKDAKATAIPWVFSENSRAKNDEEKLTSKCARW